MDSFTPSRLTIVRQVEGITTAELAVKLGKKESLVRFWEQGVQVPELADLVQLEWVTGWPIKYLQSSDIEVNSFDFCSLNIHSPIPESELCVECGQPAEFLCDQRGSDGQYSCSTALCVVHAISAHGGDYCSIHLQSHQLVTS